MKTGTATLAGGVQFIPIDAGVLGEYTFLYAAGGVNGTFDSLNRSDSLGNEALQVIPLSIV